MNRTGICGANPNSVVRLRNVRSVNLNLGFTNTTFSRPLFLLYWWCWLSRAALQATTVSMPLTLPD